MIREFYPHEIRSKIRVYRDGKEVKPLMATCIFMSENPDVEVDGYIDLVTLLRDENDNVKLDQFGNPLWLISDSNLEQDWYEANQQAREIGLPEITERPTPDIRRLYGKIRWELVK